MQLETESALLKPRTDLILLLLMLGVSSAHPPGTKRPAGRPLRAW